MHLINRTSLRESAAGHRLCIALMLTMYRVEHIRACCDIEPEAPTNGPLQPPANWPSRGAIRFKHYSTTYLNGLPEVLKGLNFDMPAFERIGVVGRTGAGKSSLALALLRALEATEGSIIIDGTDISKIGLHDLRQAIAFVPQDPSLFASDLRSNLDPFGEYTDGQIQDALKDVGLLNSGNKDGGDGGFQDGDQ